MTDDFKHAKITGQDMRDHWGPIVDRIADEISDPRDARIVALTAENERLRAEIDSIKHFRASFAPEVAEKLFGTHGQ